LSPPSLVILIFDEAKPRDLQFFFHLAKYPREKALNARDHTVRETR
jgi:hypothetical protein